MKTRKYLLIAMTSVVLAACLSACSGGGGGGGGGDVNNTTWNELVWDDGVNDKTRKWAD